MPARSTSLIELKRQQWEQEKEEMRQCGGFWGRFGDGRDALQRPCIRSQFNSTSDLKTNNSTLSLIESRRRTPSLPPIGSSTLNRLDPPDEDKLEQGGDTSGYASDSAGNESTDNWKPPWNSIFPRRASEVSSNGSYNREERERVKWGERGLGVGHLWSPKVDIANQLLPQIDQTGPAWLQRGLQEPAQVLVITHDESLPPSLANSHDMSRSCETFFTCTESERSFVRGQNGTVDPEILVEKEKKRQKALEHQRAIAQQLEEKEIKKRKDQEKLEMEERAEEERLRKYRELEARRLEEEKRKQRAKEEKEERVARALKEAIEIAEKKAKEDKANARRRRAVKSPNPPANTEVARTPDVSREPQPQSPCPSQMENAQIPETRADPPSNLSNESEKSIQRPDLPDPKPLASPPRTPQQNSVQPSGIEDESFQYQETTSVTDAPSPSTITLAVHEITFETAELEVSRLAVVPPTDEGRILTPTKFRQALLSTSERSTQTERTLRRHLRLEDRPKWGVNRPPTRFIKASDRDPYRRTRSLQRTSRDADDSRSPSPLQNKTLRGTSCSPHNSDSSSKSHKGVGTPRVVQVLPHAGVLKKSSSGRKYLSIKNTPRSSTTRPLPPRKFNEEESLTFRDVLSQLTSLKQGLIMKQREWEVTRSPTPFSEVSSMGQ